MTDTTTWRDSRPDSDTWVATGVRPVDVLGAVVDTVGNLDDLLWATKAPGELLDTLRTLEKLRSTVDAVQLQVVAAVDATSAAKSEGWASTKDFVTAVTGGPKGAGRRTVALAHAVTTDRTATGGLLAAGLISRAQAEVVVTAVDRLPVNPALRAAAERLLLLEARDHDATDLARRGRYVVERLDPDGVERRDEEALDREERAAHLSRFLSVVEDGIGGVRLRGRGSVEDAAWLKAVLFPLAAPRPTGEPGSCGGTPVTPDDRSAGRRGGDRPGACGVADCAHDGQDPREHGARMWDALVEASKLLAGTEILPESHGARPRITVTLDHDTLVAGLTDGPASRVGGGLLDSGGSLSVTAVRRLACDAEILPMVLGSKSQILDVGRSSRLVTPGIWLALVARDEHCAFPGCTRAPVACDAHHITHWAEGGATGLHNLVLLCRRHHAVIHTTPWDVRVRADDQRPEFLPPARLDPQRKPLRRRPLRE